MQQLLVTTAELAHEGNVLRSGMPKPLHLALFVERFKREVRAPFPPAWMVRVLMAPLAALARRRGHAERYVPAFACPRPGCTPGPAGDATRRQRPGAGALRWAECSGPWSCPHSRSALLAALLAPPAHAAGYKTLFDGRSRAGLAPRRRRARRGARRRRCAPRRATASASSTTPASATATSSLRLRFRAAEGANSGVHLRFPKPGGTLLVDRLRPRGPDQRHRRRPAPDGLDLRLRRPRRRPRAGQAGRTRWSTLTIRVEGQTYTVYRDGRRINRYIGVTPAQRLHRPAGARRRSGRRRVPGHPDPRALSLLPQDRVARRRHVGAELAPAPRPAPRGGSRRSVSTCESTPP